MGNDRCEGRMRERRPQIILSIAQETEEEIVRVAKAWGETHEGRVLYGSDCYDIVEWRADHFAQVFHFAETRKVLLRLRQIFSGKPILFTFRTGEEGGEKEASTEAYFDLNKMVCESGLADFIDVEAFAKGDVAEKVIAVAHQQRVKVIASHHDFVKTPAKREICRRLLYMEALKADILKIAYRARTGEEVLRLMDLARKREASGVRQPLIALSMGEQGRISRMIGEGYGSFATFASAGEATAPGQIHAVEMYRLLTGFHRMLQPGENGGLPKWRTNLFLIGFMGSGKSSVAAYLHRLLAAGDLDMDREIEKREGRTITDLFLMEGETCFRNLETALLEEVQEGDGTVVACGGGAVLRESNVDVMRKRGKVVWLDTPLLTVFHRTRGDHSRPLLENKRTLRDIAEMMEERRPYYEEASDVRVVTEGKSIPEICEEIVRSVLLQSIGYRKK